MTSDTPNTPPPSSRSRITDPERLKEILLGRKRKFPTRTVAILGVLSFLFVTMTAVIFLLYYYSRDLPDYTKLSDYSPAVVTRIYAGDGKLLKEYANEKRVFVPIENIPQRVKDAFLSAEDKTFYSHSGIDVPGLASAVIKNVGNYVQGRRLIGASTITQQVTKNLLLSSETTIERKVKEAILSFRMEKSFTKDQILELYLNQIYLGASSYGVASAALNYFNKSLDELSIAEAAYLAALPKAPNNYHPVRRHDAAVARRNWVIERMREDDKISKKDAKQATDAPLVTSPRIEEEIANADYFAEEVRRELVTMYGTQALYDEGLYVKATVNQGLQNLAQKTLRRGLLAYDRRHGYRGALASIAINRDWPDRLNEIDRPKGALDSWRLAVVLDIRDEGARLGFGSGAVGLLPRRELNWAGNPPVDTEEGVDENSRRAGLRAGNVILVERASKARELDDEEDAAADAALDTYRLRQVPAVNGAIVAMDPHTGRVLAMSGGFSFDVSEFNRATQAMRQSGSAIKPFVYLAALESGFTPASIVIDAPIVIERESGEYWKPDNYSNDFLGPSPLRVGIEKSRNLMTVRLAQAVGMTKVTDTIERFGIAKSVPHELGVALGSEETTLLKLTSAYAMLVNGGKRIDPNFIDRVEDRHGKIIFRHDTRACDGCAGDDADPATLPALDDERKKIVDPRHAYQMVSMLEGVVRRGTAVRASDIGKPLGGKTGTTNDFKDTWFIGFSPDLAVGVFVGFDTPKTLGHDEAASNVTVPIFRDFMMDALRQKPATPFRMPKGIRLVRINAKTGLPAGSGGDDSGPFIEEAFIAGTEPSTQSYTSPLGENDAPDAAVPEEEESSGGTGDVPSVPSRGPVTPENDGLGGIY